MPSSISARVTLRARWADSSRLSANCWLPPTMGLSSVKPLTISMSSRSPRTNCKAGTRLFSSCWPSGRNWSELTGNSTLPLMPMRPLFSVTRPAASGMASAFSSAMRRCSSAWRLPTSACRLATRSICTTSTPTRISTNAPSRPAIRSPKTAHTGAACAMLSSSMPSRPSALVMPRSLRLRRRACCRDCCHDYAGLPPGLAAS